ncbi:MAG: right-handed parallel beta-helix repeat-containing protein [Candidatus Thorarchaeota archaeon]
MFTHRGLIAIAFVILIMGMMWTTLGQERTDTQGSYHIAQTFIAPIVITNDLDLQIFPGLGTQQHPFLIEHYYIHGSEIGIVLRNTTNHVIIQDCYIEGGTEASIQIINSINVIIKDCMITNATAGISLYQTNNIKISANNVSLCNTGIKISDSINVTIEENRIYQNAMGISVMNTSYGTILKNTIFGNNQTGITLDTNTERLMIFSNMIGWNTPADSFSAGWNAVDGGVMNLWDNNVSIGNMWNDYSGTGDYQIRGPSNSRDRFPSKLTDSTNPSIDEIDNYANVTVIIDEKPPVIIWSVYDKFPSTYYITVNGIDLPEQQWDNGRISFILSDLKIGINTIVIHIRDCAGNVASDTVQVTVNRRGLVDDPDAIVLASLISVVGVALLIGGMKKIL